MEPEKRYLAPRRQARKERLLLISPNLGALCAVARDRFFPISSSSENFKYPWLEFVSDFDIRISDFILVVFWRDKLC